MLCLAWHKERGAGVTILVEAAPVQPSACQLTTPVPRPASPAAAADTTAAAVAAATLSYPPLLLLLHTSPARAVLPFMSLVMYA